MPVFTGSNGNDILIGTIGDDTMFGLGNNDRLVGGGGNDTLDGGAGRDFLEGQDGNDRLDGGAEADILAGGAGNDHLIAADDGDRLEGGTGNDVYELVSGSNITIVEAAGSGVDTVQQRIAVFTLPDHVENLESFGVLGIGNALDNTMRAGGASGTKLQGLDGNDQLFGADGNDHLEGGAGSDRLEGGKGNDLIDGGAGEDRMFGGEGDDTYIVSGALDFIFDIDPGVDRVVASVNHTLNNGVENLTLAEVAEATQGTGNPFNNEILGNAAANLLQGLAGNDRLLGGIGDDTLEGGMGNDELRGESGNDLMQGGIGDDLYFVTDAGDLVAELADEGSDDLILSTIDFTLPEHVEKLVLNGGSVGIGNDGDNSIGTNVGASILRGLGGRDELNGGAGNDVLDGGAGDDIMNGHEGDDIYIVDHVDDLTQEDGVSDTDTVQSSVSYALSAELEVLQLTGTLGIDGKGNELNNLITGNGANNVLSGEAGNDTLRGGAGADTLLGGFGNDQLDGGTGADLMGGAAGNDSYIVDSTLDVINESLNHGSDTVRSSVSFTLSNNVEHMSLTGNANIDATGNGSNNQLTGNFARNVMSGGAGNDALNGSGGADVLLGGEGNDTFVFDALDLSVAGLRWDGGAGTDTVKMGGSAKLLDLTSLSDERIAGIEIVDLTGSGANKISFSANDIKALSDTDTLRIDGNAGDSASIAGSGWTPGNDVAIGQNLYHTFVNAGATLLIDVDVAAFMLV